LGDDIEAVNWDHATSDALNATTFKTSMGYAVAHCCCADGKRGGQEEERAAADLAGETKAELQLEQVLIQPLGTEVSFSWCIGCVLH